MKWLIYTFVVISFTLAHAHQLYRHIGPNGEVYFTDQPGPDSAPVEISPINVKPATPARTAPAEIQSEQESPFSYEYFYILSPEEDQGVRANSGHVIVNLAIRPALQPGHMIKLKFDGEDGKTIKSGEALTIDIFNVSRGLHTVQAFVLDENKQPLMEAGPVSFHVLRVALGNR